jgi:5-methylcytosine-specific restriction endonuclease McrA
MPCEPFYSSAAWRALRARAVRAAGGRCELCSADVRAKGASRVDHRIPRDKAPEMALKLSNLRVLCASCDNRRHAEKGRPLDAGPDVRDTDAHGNPTSPDHPWNRSRRKPKP